MTTDHDFDTLPGWQDLQSAGQVPSASPETLSRARRELPTRTPAKRSGVGRRLVPVLAAAAVAATAGLVAVQRGGSDPAPVPQAVPTLTPEDGGPTTNPSQSTESCALAPTAANLRKRAFAFDGTVTGISRPEPLNYPFYRITFRVTEWFRPATGPRTVTVEVTAIGGKNGEPLPEDGLKYDIGRRILITGMPLHGGSALRDPVAWDCGFSRPYTATDAATWRKLFK